MWAGQQRHCRDRGAVAVEMALLLPFLLSLLAGMFDFALAFNAQIQVSQAAQAGARAAALGLDEGTVVGRAQGASPALHLGSGNVATSGCAGGSDTATVTVSHDFQMPIPIPGVDTSITVKQRAVSPCAPMS